MYDNVLLLCGPQSKPFSEWRVTPSMILCQDRFDFVCSVEWLEQAETDLVGAGMGGLEGLTGTSKARSGHTRLQRICFGSVSMVPCPSKWQPLYRLHWALSGSIITRNCSLCTWQTHTHTQNITISLRHSNTNNPVSELNIHFDNRVQNNTKIRMRKE